MARVQKVVESDRPDPMPEASDDSVPETYPEGLPAEHRKAIDNAKAMASSMNLRPAAEANPPEPTNKQYRVANHDPVRVMVGGYVCEMKRGKIVDSSVYDLQSLRLQGVNLEEIG